MKKRKVKYIFTQQFVTNKPNPTEEELKAIFNRKYFKCIIKIEKNLINDDTKK